MRRIAEEIRGAFKAAGWDAGEPIGEEEAESMEMVIRAEASKYAIVAPRSVLVLDQPIFELFDTDSDTAIWVRKIPNPQRAAELLARYDVPRTRQTR